MKPAFILSVLLLLSSPLLAQSLPCEKNTNCCNRGKDAKTWHALNDGVRWESSFEAAKKRAAKEGKPILLYQLVGDLDKEGC